MDNTNSTVTPPTQNQNPVQGTLPQKQINQSVQRQQSIQQPLESISVGRSKEMPSMPSTEWVVPSTPEIVLPREIEAEGIEAKPILPPIPLDVAQAGVVHAKEATPVSIVKEVPLSMQTPRSVLQQLKQTHKKVTEGFSWLVRLIIKEQDKKEKGASL